MVPPTGRPPFFARPTDFPHILEGAMPAVTSLAAAAAILAVRAVGALGSAGQRALHRLVRAIRNRYDAAKLTGLDDRMLADIGITRSDLRDAFAEPLWHDPTDLLARRHAESRCSRRRAAFEHSTTSKRAVPGCGSTPAPGHPSADRAARYLI
jgi:uncharacterized protein YjiS (DUF1127 family)